MVIKMDKRLKTGLIVGGVIAAGAALYFIFKKDPDEGTPTGDPVGDNEAYLNKVKELQKLIGVGVDGVIGDKTKAALAKYGVTDAVGSGNIDSILTTVRGKITAKGTDSARYAKGLQILTYLKNKPGMVKFTADATVNIYTKDVFGKFIKTGDTIKFKTGNTFKPLYMINSTPTNTLGTGFKPGFMMFEITRPLDFNYLFTKAPKFYIGPISSFSITVV
jgi:hypothetical protein